MPFNVPYSESPRDEFQTPGGVWYSTLRAITFDSWLLWRHALPEDIALWPQLTQPVFDSIEALGLRIHQIHQLLPDYRRLSDSPFHVSIWWDPADTSGDWSLGDRAQLRINGYTASDIHNELTPRLKASLQLRTLSKHWIEVSLPRQQQMNSEASESP